MKYGWFNDNHGYKVDFDFVNDLGEIVHTDLDNNGTGFTLSEALHVRKELMQQGNRNVTIVEIIIQSKENA